MTLEAAETVTISRRGLSPVWQFRSAVGPLARAVPYRRRTARVDLPDGRTWLILSEGPDGFRLLEGDLLLGSAERLDPWARRWEVASNRFCYELTNRSGLKGRWTIGPPDAVVADLRMWTTRRMHLHSHLPVPMEALALVWYIIIRMAFPLSSLGRGVGGGYGPGARGSTT